MEEDVHISVNISNSLADMLKRAMLKSGFKTKSEFVRVAIKEKVERVLEGARHDG